MELTSLSDLLELQEIDLQIDRLLEARQSLPELEQYRAAHEALEEKKREREGLAAELRQLELDLDKAEGELEMLEAKLSEHETRLFAGGMSARETEHMRLEVQSLRGQKDAMEEKVLGLLEQVDPVRAAVAAVDAEIEKIEAAKASLESKIKEQWAVIDAELARKEARKKEAMEPIDPELLDLYENLRSHKEGVAVAAYDHGVCGGCHMALSPAEQEEAFSGDLPRCVHCRRILVA
ncbi:MAG TPA: C4-type zinc ribbon domain-containing protein [Acidimicrobiia bacterium]|jgi:predicted  nucleic acid-binding Zn-ribbon protein|nr:C4-type zinc ribbon domain-containing protein [Acidimicrobiia bacterium]